LPAFAVPVIVGLAAVSVPAATLAVALDVAAAVAKPASDAVTRTAIALPYWAAATFRVAPVAPVIAVPVIAGVTLVAGFRTDAFNRPQYRLNSGADHQIVQLSQRVFIYRLPAMSYALPQGVEPIPSPGRRAEPPQAQPGGPARRVATGADCRPWASPRPRRRAPRGGLPRWLLHGFGALVREAEDHVGVAWRFAAA
jgi:hypothetical protein